MAARSWLLLLCLAAAAGCVVLKARAQPDSIGFINIDCGMPGTASRVDDTTKLSYAPDAAFTVDAGSNHNISAEYVTPQLPRGFHDLRSFPDGAARSCYTLRSLEAGLKYLVRAFFMYGDYDGLRRPPVFEVYVGVNFLSTVNVSEPGVPEMLEAIVVVPDSFLQLCLVNIGSGTPFVSTLELRPLKTRFYPQANATHGLALVGRANFGPTNDSYAAIVRYPDDPHDRLWIPSVDAANWTVISTTSWVQNIHKDLFGAPSKVMQTAITPRNASKNIELFWEPKPVPKDPSLGYITVMHFSELQELPHGAVRHIYISFNGRYVEDFTPDLLYAETAYNVIPVGGYARYNVSLNATANSTLPPIINAMEVFSLFPTTNVGTDSIDVAAITAIKDKYSVRKNWMGDPCFPKALAWDRLACSYAVSSPPRITSLDLSNNNLTGSIPDALSKLPSLVLLDLTGNQLSGSIPSGLLRRIQDGSLNLKYGNNPHLCTDGNSCQDVKGKSKLTAVYIAVPVALAVVAVVVLLLCFIIRREKHGSVSSRSAKPRIEPTDNAHDDHSSLQQRNRQFTYKELQIITKNFQTVLGKGGFGVVYEGFLEDRTQVAVKLRSQTTSDKSDHGVKQFLAEVEILTRIHHRNLVSMIGYCKDGDHLGLVYEYMPLGTLQQHIAGNDGRYLTWRQRLQIALESALGLEYLHKGCSPPLIHRDVKLANILLSARLEAKIADFGLSKAFNHDDTHVATATIAGTPGYLDPEYRVTGKPTSKSDVYSFGVVLLELVAGRPANLRDPENTSIIHWARQRLAQGNIEAVVDPRMGGNHDINSVWKVANIALSCTAEASAERPTMTDVVAELQECLELEKGHASGDDTSGHFYSANGSDRPQDNDHSTDVSRSSTTFEVEVERNFGRVPTMPTGPAVR
ncbi:putative leucine-rich repeat receptor-like protein kinase At2g19210 [Sorghum bicolor]|uniref:putative leucine-rich repeat receptor-like protein kinase At2g19210 n=1 Tax=Sorghum bicolor TaxID=4558 RepID=UPI000B425B1A|nr:putative leucine-rich repeat receptor-like protein kinase At2g19210 [Sorghum bicolor]|eukprot:XP_021303599.1 putative leucine-rich repeat receptor-like protein kinase At2g19210 [Sorghum bicolor]